MTPSDRSRTEANIWIGSGPLPCAGRLQRIWTPTRMFNCFPARCTKFVLKVNIRVTYMFPSRGKAVTLTDYRNSRLPASILKRWKWNNNIIRHHPNHVSIHTCEPQRHPDALSLPKLYHGRHPVMAVKLRDHTSWQVQCICNASPPACNNRDVVLRSKPHSLYSKGGYLRQFKFVFECDWKFS